MRGSGRPNLPCAGGRPGARALGSGRQTGSLCVPAATTDDRSRHQNTYGATCRTWPGPGSESLLCVLAVHAWGHQNSLEHESAPLSSYPHPSPLRSEQFPLAQTGSGALMCVRLRPECRHPATPTPAPRPPCTGLRGSAGDSAVTCHRYRLLRKRSAQHSALRRPLEPSGHGQPRPGPARDSTGAGRRRPSLLSQRTGAEERSGHRKGCGSHAARGQH